MNANIYARPCSVWILREVFERNEWREINKFFFIEDCAQEFWDPNTNKAHPNQPMNADSGFMFETF